MQRKIVPAQVIVSCDGCPHFGESEFDSSHAWCGHQNHPAPGLRYFREEELEFHDDIQIPPWCPLDDAPQGLPQGEAA